MTPRYYQTDAIAATLAGEADYQRQLIVIPTGGGKTIVFSLLALEEARRGGCTLILAHREELLVQAQDKLRLATGLEAAIEQAEKKAHILWADDLFAGNRPSAVVGSVQSFSAKRLAMWPKDAFTRIIIDEAHHALSAMYQRVLAHFTGARVVGVTATPDRGDRKNLGSIFQNIAYEYSLTQAIKDGFLCPIKAKLIPLELDLSTVRTVGGDFDANDLDIGLEPYLKRLAGEVAANIESRQTLVFLPLIKTSKAFTELLCGLGIRAEHVDGESPDRKDILGRYEKRDFQVLSNSSLLLEGYDCPPISCVVPLRPTKVRSLYQQIVGRGTRICEGKDDLLLLDFLWNTQAHDLCVPASLVAKSSEEAQMIMDIVKQGGTLLGDDEGVDILEAQEEFKHARERSLAQKLKEQSKKKKKTIDPIRFALSLHDDDLAEYVPVMSWEAAPITDKQRDALEKFGFDVDAVWCKGQASMILDKVFKRRQEGLCSPKQANLLGKYGYDTNDMSFDDASTLISRIAANGWAPVPYSPAPKKEPALVAAGVNESDEDDEEVPF